MSSPDDNYDDLPEKSKTQLKREASALQDLGVQLTTLTKEQLQQLPLPDTLLKAVLDAKKIHQHGGSKRQRQYIGKLMRHIDPDPITHAIQGFKINQQRETARLHKLEQWRDQLIGKDKSVMAELIAQFPQLDRQHINQLIRNAQYETSKQLPPKSSRKIFHYLQSLDNDED